MQAAIEDAGRNGATRSWVPLPVGVPEAFTETGRGPARRRHMARYARTHGPFTADAWRAVWEGLEG